MSELLNADSLLIGKRFFSLDDRSVVEIEGWTTNTRLRSR